MKTMTVTYAEEQEDELLTALQQLNVSFEPNQPLNEPGKILWFPTYHFGAGNESLSREEIYGEDGR